MGQVMATDRAGRVRSVLEGRGFTAQSAEEGVTLFTGPVGVVAIAADGSVRGASGTRPGLDEILDVVKSTTSDTVAD